MPQSESRFNLMTNSPANLPVNKADQAQTLPVKLPDRTKRERLSLAIQLALSLALVFGVFAYLQWSGSRTSSSEDEKRPTRPEETVELVGPQSIRVRPETPLHAKLQVAQVEAATLTAPVLPVTGMTLATLRPGKEAAQDTWQFASPDLLTAFTDWQKAVVDVQFQKTQLQSVRQLADYRVEAQKEVVDRMVKLKAAGTETEKSLIAEQVTLKQFEIQGKKEIHEAENAVKVAEKTEAALSRQLQQAGLEPTMLRSAAAEGEIVVAEVPERAIARVKLGMTSEVRFYALPNRVFTGKISAISPVVSKDKRILNVQFIVKDPEKVVRPGMFAEIGLGTDQRQALLMPADGLLHVGDKDYALLSGEEGAWKITEVETGELRGANVEILAGLKAGDQVLGKGAILLKPIVVRAVQPPVSSSSNKVGEQPGGKSQ
jgi:hypothetical protein